MRILALLLCLLANPAVATDRASVERQFQSWLVTNIWPEARRAGVGQDTFQAAFKGVRLNWDLPDLVPPGASDRPKGRQSQAEFRAPSRYFAQGALSGNTSIGRDMARRHAEVLARIEARTGVPGRIILSIWGRESAFGRASIPHNAFEVLGTKGFMSRRKDYFRGELIAALRIAEAGHIAPGAMRSSWAGALGQPQFMPSSFLNYAADGTGDGRANIWTSEVDTLASIANYLARHGWIAGRDWGFEVTVPERISCALEGPDQGRRIRDWEALGITRVSGRPFPDHERGGEAFLMMPAGRLGPAFLVTPNFYVLKDYNQSDLYALFVGHVADRIQYGVGNFRGGWAKVDTLSRGDVARLQDALIAKDHDVGGADGLAGFKTRRSIGRWQAENGLAQTCFPSRRLARTLAK